MDYLCPIVDPRKEQNMDLNYVRTQVKIEKDGFICPDSGHKSKSKKMDLFVLCVRIYEQMYVPGKIRILIVSGHKSNSQKMDFIYVRT